MAGDLNLGRQVVVLWWDHTSPPDWQDTEPSPPALAEVVGWLVAWRPDADPPHLVVSRVRYPKDGHNVDLFTILLGDVVEIRAWARSNPVWPQKTGP